MYVGADMALLENSKQRSRVPGRLDQLVREFIP
jgi:hypothetical protein